jgi:hypothetical protein
MADLTCNTKDAVDTEVKRALFKSRKIFVEYAKKYYRLDDRSGLCSTCDNVCRLSNLSIHQSYLLYTDLPRVYGSEWSKTKKSFAKATSSTGCHLYIIIARAFDKIATFAKMGPDETLKARFAYRTAERDPSGKLDWEQRTRMTINNITLGTNIPDEFWLRIISIEEMSWFSKLHINLRMRLFKGENTAHLISEYRREHFPFPPLDLSSCCFSLSGR